DIVSHSRIGVKAHWAFFFEGGKIIPHAAIGRTELGELLVELRPPPAEIRPLLNDDGVIAGLGRLDGRRDPGNPATDHEDRAIHAGRGDLAAHGIKGTYGFLDNVHSPVAAS